MKTFVLAPSRSSNSLGRAISMALTARELGQVELWALDDGPLWVAAPKFGVEVRAFAADRLSPVLERLIDASLTDDVLVWMSKGLSPLDRVAAHVTAHARVTVIQDYDEDDLALVSQHVRFVPRSPRSSLKRALQFPPHHPRSPLRVRRAQSRAASAAVAFSFTSNAIRDVYMARGIGAHPCARIPHTRSYLPLSEVPARPQATSTAPALGFLGTIRPHKGLDAIVDLVEAMPDAHMVSFSQRWRPPVRLRDRWTELPSDLPIEEAYRNVDILLVPQDLDSDVAQTQLSAKILDAALFGRAVVGSPTKTLEEYCAGAYIPVSDWSDAASVANRIRESDLAALGMRLRERYETYFSPARTSATLLDLWRRAQSGE